MVTYEVVISISNNGDNTEDERILEVALKMIRDIEIQRGGSSLRVVSVEEAD